MYNIDAILRSAVMVGEDIRWSGWEVGWRYFGNHWKENLRSVNDVQQFRRTYVEHEELLFPSWKSQKKIEQILSIFIQKNFAHKSQNIQQFYL